MLTTLASGATASSFFPEGFKISDGLGDLKTLIDWGIGLITQFPMNIFFAASMAGLGIGIYRKVKHL